jgi:hypothetical protein
VRSSVTACNNFKVTWENEVWKEVCSCEAGRGTIWWKIGRELGLGGKMNRRFVPYIAKIKFGSTY